MFKVWIKQAHAQELLEEDLQQKVEIYKIYSKMPPEFSLQAFF